MRVTTYANPVSRISLRLGMLLTAFALLLWFGFGGVRPTGIVEDHYLAGGLALGLHGLAGQIRTVAVLEPSPSPPDIAICTPMPKSLACLLARLNSDLQHLPKPMQLDLPPADLAEREREAMKSAARWLLRYRLAPADLQNALTDPDAAMLSLAAMRDPFRLEGCIYLADSTPLTDMGACHKPELLEQTPFWPGLLGSMLNYRIPWRKQTAVQQTQQYKLDPEGEISTPLVVGANVGLGLRADLQKQAQTTVAFFTGSTSAQACYWCPDMQAGTFFEAAPASMMGMLLVDAEDGSIVASASSHTPCFEQRQQGRDGGANCPGWPAPLRKRTSRLNDHALLDESMPGSLVKILEALALLRSGLPPASAAKLAWILTHSKTPEMIDLLLCEDQGFDPACAARRLVLMQQAANRLGWNVGCAQGDCRSRIDMLGGGSVPELRLNAPGGQWLLGMEKDNGVLRPLNPASLHLRAEAIKNCYRQGAQQRWRGCQGGLATLVAELFGQGSARSSPLAVANAWLHLAAALQGRNQAPQAHLVSARDTTTAQAVPVRPTVPVALTRQEALALQTGLGQAHRIGSAQVACFKATTLNRNRNIPCDLPAVLMSKTGTPLFPAANLTLAQWRSACDELREQASAPATTRVRRAKLDQEVDRLCMSSPVKWYAAVLGTHDKPRYVMVVLSERSWKRDGRLGDEKDEENVAAVAGLSLAKLLCDKHMDRAC